MLSGAMNSGEGSIFKCSAKELFANKQAEELQRRKRDIVRTLDEQLGQQLRGIRSVVGDGRNVVLRNEGKRGNNTQLEK